MARLSWYLKRLSVMRPSEIIHRLSEQLRLMWMWLVHRYYGGCIPHKSLQWDKYDFCRSPDSRLPPLTWEFNLENEDISHYLSGSIDAFGYQFQWKDISGIWHIGPDTGKKWPASFFASIQYRAGNPYGDARVVWEPSRLQHLITLALMANSATNEDSCRLVDLLESQFLSWCTDNPLYSGVHYISAMECALRIIAVAHALDLVRSKLRNPEAVWQAYAYMVNEHSRLIMNRLSLHSSTGNHTIAECAGLVYAGLLFPEMDDSSKWLETGLGILSKEADRQILPDGGGVEQALWYHLFVLDLMGLVSKLLKIKGKNTPDGFDAALKCGKQFLCAFGGQPDELLIVGDSDSGFALSRYLRISWDDVARTSAPLQTFNDAGYSIIQSPDLTGLRILLDHGGLGMMPSYGHGHADALSVIVGSDKDLLMIDPGTYTYTGDADWRAYFRGTRAHNTVTIDGLDQSTQQGAFMWSRSFHAELIKQDKKENGSIILLARHDGYSGVGVTHWRGVLWKEAGSILIWDYITGEGEHDIELNWHLDAKAQLIKTNEILEVPDKQLAIKVSGGHLELKSGALQPITGWKSIQYGVKEPIITASCSYTGSLPHEFITAIHHIDSELDSDSNNDEIFQMRQWVNEYS